MPKLPLTKKQQFWFDHVIACQQSGETYAAYARAHSLPRKPFYHWKHRFEQKGLLARLTSNPAKARATPFVSVVTKTSGLELKSNLSSRSSMTLVLNNGIRIELHEGYSLQDILKMVLPL